MSITLFHICSYLLLSARSAAQREAVCNSVSDDFYGPRRAAFAAFANFRSVNLTSWGRYDAAI
jgi:hypothetical protein